jgi:glycerophosphoryl diester phosphodiesterase
MLIIGHRGCRGLFPENSIKAFKEAISLGVNAIELDVVVSEDREIVVSHEPFMSQTYCLKPNGEEIRDDEDKKYNLFEMTYSQIKEFDCGMKSHPRFPNQKKLKTQKPLLKDAICFSEMFISQNLLEPINYIIEIKSNEEYYNVFYPEPAEYVKLVLRSISGFEFKERIVLKSFDVNILNEIKIQSPKTQVSILINKDEEISNKLEQLDFIPEFLGPYYKLLTKENVLNYQKLGFRIFTWTVNDVIDIKLMKSYKVDGIITDYPNRLN